MDAEYRQVNPLFFQATGVPLLEGRAFTQQDGIGLHDKHPHSGQVIVNRAFAKRLLPLENPIGKHIELYWLVGNNTKQTLLKYEIIGAVGDALERPETAAEPTSAVANAARLIVPST
ncbi:MAG TPA: ABC transporter permease [Bryobacteraceae bacterium]